ncbi:MAG: tRNA (cytidine(34)-2'-O)-methyltransferase [Rhodomicrobium sp.]|nr:MAG: tRNA (cytidine(34)-2'-O)-methyltransferase [Rhodomicrobium sp.]
MRLALYQPDIPQNTGTIMRLCACLSLPLDIIGPAGFDMSDRNLKRAGMDYLEHVDLTRHISFTTFLDSDQRRSGRLILTTTKTDQCYTDFKFKPSDILMMGRESAGVPETVAATADAAITIPMAAAVRSLNIAVAGSMIIGEALRQTKGFPTL